MGNVSDREMIFDSNSPNELGNEVETGRGNWNQTPIKFHNVHGCNIILLRDGAIARRNESFCHGLAFSNRPIAIDEVICIRFSEVGQSWSGFLRYGVTNIDPTSYREGELPKFACPDLTTKVGYWAKALPERYSQQGAILHFYVNNLGELHYGINGVVKGAFIQGINVNLPVWIIVDIYGNCKSLEFVDANEVRFRSRRRITPSQLSDVATTNTTESTVDLPPFLAPKPASSGQPLSFLSLPSTHSVYYPMVEFDRASFHSMHGRNVQLNALRNLATRRQAEYSNGYIFMSLPMKVNENVLIKINDFEHAYSGSLAYGLTSCDPSSISTSDFPDDSDELLERSEYWVGIKDVSAGPIIGDELKFCVSNEGEVLFSKNGAADRVIMHVDTSVPLWMYFDMYGSTREVRLLGAFSHQPEALQHRSSLPSQLPLEMGLVVRNIYLNRDCSSATSSSAPGQLRVDLPPSTVYSRSNSERPPNSARRAGSYRVALPSNNSVPSFVNAALNVERGMSLVSPLPSLPLAVLPPRFPGARTSSATSTLRPHPAATTKVHRLPFQ